MNPMKPVRFYGNALPRPRYLDEKAEHERVDPPAPVNDSLLRWAKDANWAMGGLSHKRQRLQGKIEGRLSKLRSFDDDDDETPKKPARKAKLSLPEKPSPKPMKRKGKKGGVRGRHGTGPTESSPIVPLRSPAAIHPWGEWGEESGPSPRRMSPRLHAASPLKPVSVSPLGAAAVSASIEFPVRRRPAERPLPDADDSDSDANWEEFSRMRDRPLRRSSRVTSIRRSFKDFAVASDSDHEA